MIITRNGMQIELTDNELMDAYDEYRLSCMIIDVKEVLVHKNIIGLREDIIKNIAMQAVHNLGKNENYSNGYWGSVEYTVEQSIKELY